jgi:hypothetical protein
LYRGIFFADAPALQTASDTAKIAFAPSWKCQDYGNAISIKWMVKTVSKKTTGDKPKKS